MLATLSLFALLVYGYAFLAADAKLFGCPTTDYKDQPDDTEYIRHAGILKIRQLFLKNAFFRELFSCYFCLGVWTGMLAHGTLVVLAPYNPHILNSYILLSNDIVGSVSSFVVAAVIGGPLCYISEIVIQILEKLTDKLEG